MKQRNSEERGGFITVLYVILSYLFLHIESECRQAQVGAVALQRLDPGLAWELRVLDRDGDHRHLLSAADELHEGHQVLTQSLALVGRVDLDVEDVYGSGAGHLVHNLT